jgi:hypothetical protein
MSEQVPQQPVTPVQQPAPVPPRGSWFGRHKVLTVVGAVVLVVIGASAIGGGGDSDPATEPDRGQQVETSGATTPPAGADEAEADPVVAPPGIGATVADGDFEFVVTQVEPGVARVGSQILGQDAQGQFVLVHVTVTNIGTEAQYFYQGAQTASDAQGRTHSADPTAAVYLDSGTLLLDQINPGNQVEGVIVFDVPADATLTSVELHDSPLSGGVTVTLG